MKKLLSLLCVVLAALFCCACAQPDDSGENNTPNEPQGLEYGFTASGGCEPQPSGQCAYRSDKNVFDIDNVTLTFYYGDIFNQDINIELEQVRNIPCFELYFSDDNGDEYLIRKVEENYVSEKYRFYPVYDNYGHEIERVFNHSEDITIPKEIFNKSEGLIRFHVRGINILETEPEMKILTGANIYYKTDGETVTLSSKKFN